MNTSNHPSINPASANQQHGHEHKSSAQRLPEIIWRGVAIDPKAGDYSSRQISGIGLVPPALYGCRTPEEAKQAETVFRNHSEHRSDGQTTKADLRHLAAYHARHHATMQPAQLANTMFTSWSSSWTYALCHALLHDDRVMRDKDGNVVLGWRRIYGSLKSVCLVGALPRHFSDRTMDLKRLLQADSVQNYLADDLKKETLAQPYERPQQMAARAEQGQEVLVFGAIPESAYFSVSLAALLGPNVLSLFETFTTDLVHFVALAKVFSYSREVSPFTNNRQRLSAAISGNGLTAEQVALRWTRTASSSRFGRFGMSRKQLNEDQRKQQEAEDVEIRQLLQHAVEQFRLNGHTKAEWWSSAMPGEICWKK